MWIKEPWRARAYDTPAFVIGMTARRDDGDGMDHDALECDLWFE